MSSCILGALYIYKVDIWTQTATSNPETGEIVRDWTFFKTIRAYVYPYLSGGMRGIGSDEAFGYGDRYANTDYIRMKSATEMDKRWRITNVRNAKTGAVVYQESIDNAPTIYNVDGSAPVVNPLSGHVDEWITTLSRAEVQG